MEGDVGGRGGSGGGQAAAAAIAVRELCAGGCGCAQLLTCVSQMLQAAVLVACRHGAGNSVAAGAEEGTAARLPAAAHAPERAWSLTVVSTAVIAGHDVGVHCRVHNAALCCWDSVQINWVMLQCQNLREQPS